MNWSATCFGQILLRYAGRRSGFRPVADRSSYLDMSRQLEPCRRPVQAILHYAILLGSRSATARELVADLLANWSQTGQRNGIWSRTGLRPASELDRVMEFGLRHAHDVHTQVFVQLASSSRTRSRAGCRPARELVASWIV